jgi:hypothetical protein
LHEWKHLAMSTTATRVAHAAAAGAPVDGVAKQPSKLFSSLLRTGDPEQRLTILEVGPALPETVDFFSRYRCRIHVLDLFSEPLVRDLQKVTSPIEIQQRFEELMVFPQDTKLDICLFWDFLCYLDDAALRAFDAALRPFIHHGTRAHGFGAHHLAIRLENKRYGVLDENTLSVRPGRAGQAETHPHSQVEMHEMLSCFDFDRGLLLPDGKLELLLKARKERAMEEFQE